MLRENRAWRLPGRSMVLSCLRNGAWVVSLLCSNGCSSYLWTTFRDNMLRPTPNLRPAEGLAPKAWDNNRVTAAWIGHSTVLINFYGTTILTDPILGERLAPNLFGANIGIRRISRLPIKPENLPPIDVVLLSHAHYDHWDTSSLKRFRPPTRAIVPLDTGDLVPRGHFASATELDWGQSTQIKDITVTAVKAEHWGFRGMSRKWRGYNGYIISGRGKRIFFAGDSAYADWATGEPVDWQERVLGGAVDLCILPIGGYFFHGNHMSPEEAWEIFGKVGGRWIMPIHWRTFIVVPLDKEPIWEPIERLRKAAGDHAGRIVGEEPGKVFVLP